MDINAATSPANTNPLTPTGSTSAPIIVPKNDPEFDPKGTGTQTLPFNRSVTDPTTGTGKDNPLNQPTVVTSFIDGSQVYGSDPARAAALRTFSGGHLAVSANNLLPFNTGGLTNANDAHVLPDNQLFLAGDIRANENIELTITPGASTQGAGVVIIDLRTT